MIAYITSQCETLGQKVTLTGMGEDSQEIIQMIQDEAKFYADTCGDCSSACKLRIIADSEPEELYQLFFGKQLT